MHRVLLSGCGNIGFRHLQALSAMSVPADIVVVEPNRDVHDRIRAEIEAAALTPHRFTLVDELPADPLDIDLAVVATTSSHRRAAIADILATHRVRVFILEKILFQTLADLDAVADLLIEHDVSAFVNCGRRSFAGYQAVAERDSAAVVDVDVRGNRFGLASNAIHFLDLAEFVNGSSLVDLDTSQLRAGSVPGRREGCVEIFGTIGASLANGARLTVDSRDDDPVAIEVTLTGPSAVHRIDEVNRQVAVDGGATAPFASKNVSETPEIYEEALVSGTCVLTPYPDSVRQHRLYITALRSHLGLSNTDDTPCPIS